MTEKSLKSLGFSMIKDFSQLIGETPLIRLNKISDMSGCEILGKAEFLNPGQSVKDRAALKIVQEAREALSLDGCYVLKSIINMEAIYEMQKEASKIENLAHYTTNKVNVYFSKDDASYPKEHPRRFFMERSNGFVSGDKFPKNSMIKELYYL